MAKAKVKQRKDSKGRVLQKGESQRKLDGMYIYTYVNPYGKRCYVYSKDLFTLREKEQELIKAQMDGLDYYVGGHATINMTFDRYMSTKHNLRETTRSNYLYMFNRFIREDFGNKFLTEVKYTDVKLFYYHLLNEKDIAINTLDGSYQLIEVKGDNKIDDEVVLAKKAAAEEMAVASGIHYLMYAGSTLMKSNVLEPTLVVQQTSIDI